MVSHNTPQTAWGSMINGAGKALKYTVYGTLTVGLALFGLDAGAHLGDNIAETFSETLDNPELAKNFSQAVGAGWGAIESGLHDFFGYNVSNMDLIEGWVESIHDAIGTVVGLPFNYPTEVGVGAAGAVGGGILTAASMKQSHADRIQQERMKLAAAEAFQRG